MSSNENQLRAAVYVDGCNLFNGMRTAKMRRCYWLDLAGLAKDFARQGQMVVRTCYFTARVRGNPEKNKRHSTYIDALKARGGVEVIEGSYQLETVFCGSCRRQINIPKEKQTDTGIATEIVADALRNQWDHAYLISADSDLIPPIRKVRQLCPDKRIIVMFPPCRSSDELRRAANGYFNINEKTLLANQFPDVVPAGHVLLKRPEYWS